MSDAQEQDTKPTEGAEPITIRVRDQVRLIINSYVFISVDSVYDIAQRKNRTRSIVHSGESALNDVIKYALSNRGRASIAYIIILSFMFARCPVVLLSVQTINTVGQGQYSVPQLAHVIFISSEHRRTMVL